jgi:uncharacterized protein YcnI
MTRLRRKLTLAAAAVGVLGLPAGAAAYAVISPAAVESKELQQFTLSVPTEQEHPTTKIELTVPPGFSIHSFEPAPAPWKLRLRKRRSGGDAVIERVTWVGGNVPTGQNSVFRFIAFASDSTTYRFAVRQTYSDGTVVDWSGPASSRTPAAFVEAHSTIGGPSLVAIAAVVVAAGGVLIGLVAHVAGRRRAT